MRLIINADDFGLTRSVNQAIIEVFEKGNLTSTTLMVNMPGTEDAISLAKQHPGLGVGLHFTLTEGKPVTDAKSLTDENGNFLKRKELIKRIFARKVRQEEIAEEFKAQLSRIYDAGLKPTHSDSHQHLHMVPFIFDALHPIAAAADLPLRLVVPNMVAGLMFKRPVKFLKQRILQANYRRLLSGPAFRHNDYLISIHDSTSLTESTQLFSQLLRPYEQQQGVTELVVHPYIDASDLEALYPGDVASHRPFFEKCFLEYRLLTQTPHLFSKYQTTNYAQL